jgi:hypothetical protein
MSLDWHVAERDTPAVDVVAAANNYLLPAWMIGLACGLSLRAERNV